MVFEGADFTSMIKSLEDMGFYEVMFPFLLIFTILFAMLEKIKLFGKDTKNINIIVAMIIAFFVVRVPAIIETMNQFLPKVSMLVLVLLMFLLVLGIFGTKAEGWGGIPFFIAMVSAVIGIFWAIMSSLPAFSMRLPTWLRLSASDKGLLMAVGIFILILFMFKEKPKEEKRGFWKAAKEEFGPEMFGRGK